MTAPDTADIGLSPRERLEILGAILLALFLFALDQTVVGTALPVIVTDLQGNDLYVWVVTIYLLTSTISGPVYGKLSDLFGRRPIIIFAVSLFLISSVLSGLSQEMWQLILFRGLQGLGGGAIFPVALAVVADLYTPAERGKYLGLFGAVFGRLVADRPGHRWGHHRHRRLALDLLRQRADRAGLAGHHLAPAAGDQAARRGPAHRLRRRVGVHRRDRPVPDRADQQAAPATGPIRRVGGLILARAGVRGALPVDRVARRRIRSCPLGLFRIRTFTISVMAMFLAAFGFFARDHLPAALVPDGRRRERDGFGLQPAAAARRADRQRDRCRARSWPGPAATRC